MKNQFHNIIVYKSPIDLTIIFRCNRISTLLRYNESANFNADQVSIDGEIILGWDEIQNY